MVPGLGHFRADGGTLMAWWRLLADNEPRWAHGDLEAGPTVLLPRGLTLGDLLQRGAWSRREELLEHAVPVQGTPVVLAPTDEQEVWASGVTYRRSRDARLEESDQLDAYDKVYVAERPELFWKAAPGEARGPGQTIGVRADSSWDVPEPEVAFVLDVTGTPVAACVANDVSSRSIEGENPLYLPQAKVYRHSLGLGPALVELADLDLTMAVVELEVERAGEVVVDGSVPFSEMHREPRTLAGWLTRARDFPRGAILLTGTGIVPSSSFTLQDGDVCRIRVTGLGTLTNVVETVGA